MRPQQGDVLVSNESATIDYIVSVVPGRSHFCGPRHDAIKSARDLAKRLGVDAWLTEDRTHFKRIVTYRPKADPRQR